MKDTRSKELYERAKVHIPGGVNSPVRAFRAVNRTPRFMESAKGDRIIDADGNEYIDYVCSWGPGILGHAHPQVIKKVMDSCENGLTFGAPTEKEVILAELISELIPSMEVSRLVSSGTEAVMSAIRAARGFTGRDKIVKFRGCYHGHSDSLLVKAGSGALTTSVPDSAGVPKDDTKNTLVAEYNDKDSVQKLFDENTDGYGNILILKDAAIISKLSTIPDLLKGDLVGNDNIEYIKARNIRISSEVKLESDVDGDKSDNLPVDIKILGNHIEVFSGMKE